MPNDYHQNIWDCTKIRDFKDRQRCSKKVLETSRDQIGLVDQNSFIHFIIGLIAGFLVVWFITDTILWLIVGSIITFMIWFGFHYIIFGYATLNHKNPIMDTILLFSGYFIAVILIILIK